MTTQAKYGLYDFSGEYGSYLLMYSHDFKGHPLMTLEQAQDMLKLFPERPTMGIELLNN